MEKQQLVEGWTEIVLNPELSILGLTNADQRLLWGNTYTSNYTGHSLDELATSLCGSNRVQLSKLKEGIRRASVLKRPVYEEYTSTLPDAEIVYVGAHIHCVNQNIKILLTEIHADDYHRLHNNVTPAESFTATLLPAIYESLPMGLEVYDADGRLIELNKKEMEFMGVKDKSQVLGLNLFDNPNLPEEMKARLLAGENVRTILDYDFKKAHSFFQSTATERRFFDVLIFIIRNSEGKIDKYFTIVQDQTDYVSLRKEFERISNETQTILESLPVGVELYNPEGKLIYMNNADCHIFGVEKKDILSNNINIANNPNLPDQIKEAVKSGRESYACFPYSFANVEEKGYYRTNSQKDIVRQIECKGMPVLNPNGELEKYAFIVKDITEAVQSEQALRQSKQKSELAMKATEIMLWEFDTEKRWFTSENEPLNNYQSSKPILIKEYLSAFHPDDQERSSQFIDRMLAGEDFSFSIDIRAKYFEENDWQYCTICAAPYERDINGKIIKYVGSRKNNSELIRQRMFQEKVLNSIALPIHIKDVNDEYRYVFCNDESKKVLGVSVGKRALDLVSQEQMVKIQQADFEVYTTGKSSMTNERIVLNNGHTYDMMVQRDIIYDGNKRLVLTARFDQSLLNELSRKSKVLSLSMNALNAFPWFYDHDTSSLTYGEGFERDGRDNHRVASLWKLADCLHPEDQQRFIDLMNEVLSKDFSDFAVEYRADLTGNGTYEWWECRGVLETVNYGNGSHKYMYGMDINIGSHKKVEFDLIEAKRLAEQSDRLKSAFLANMSHEIRTPLNAIVGFSDLLMNSEEVEEKTEYMQIINNNTELLLKLINDILDLSKIEAGAVELKEEVFDLAYHFNSIASAMEQRMKNSCVRLVVTNPYESYIIRGDRNRLSQIVTNYVTNAIKYTTKGTIEMGYEVTDGFIRFFVKDTGIGIPDEKRCRVFHRFEKLDEFAQGTGLGLSICRAIAEAMGGRVGFDSVYGEGSTFWAEVRKTLL